MSSLSNSQNDDMKTTARKGLAALDIRRKALESEGEAIISELNAKGPNGEAPMGIDTPLVDREGYPRGDIDVYRARELRHRLNEIKTDHKALMKEIDAGLKKLATFQSPSLAQKEEDELAARRAPKPKPKMDPVTGKWVVANWDGSVSGIKNGEKRSFNNLEKGTSRSGTEPTSSTSNAASNTANSESIITESMETTSLQDEQQPTEPFAKVNSVASNSPASEAGLLEGDLVMQFDKIDHTNHRDLMAIAEIVPLAASEGKGIDIIVLRQLGQETPTTRTKRLRLVPKPWGGRGLLGCHIVKC